MKKFKHSEITPEKIYKKRRSFIKSMGYGLIEDLLLSLWVMA